MKLCPTHIQGKGMKTKNIKFFISFIAVSITMLLTSCSTGSPLKDAVEKLQRDLPMQINDFMSMDEISYENDVLEMVYGVDEDLIDIQALKANPKMLKQNAKLVVSNASGDFKTVVDQLVKEGAGMRVTYIGRDSGAKVSVTLSGDELRKSSEMDADPMELLQAQIDVTNAQMPMQADEATVLNKLTLEGNYVYYNYTIDEDKLSISVMKQNEASMRAYLKQLIDNPDPTATTFYDACRNAGYGIAHRYVGCYSGEVCEFKFNL